VIESIIALVLIGGVAYGLMYWASRAERDRSAYVGLYLLFGIPGILLLVAGLAFVVYGRDNGWLLLAIGGGLTLPLAKGFRAFLARFTPMDPTSPVDFAGLSVMLAIIGFFVVGFFNSPDPDETEAVSIAELVVQVMLLVMLSYISVGFGLRRNFRQATARLGVTRPTFKTVGIGLAGVIVALVFSAAAGVATEVFQPDVSTEIEEGVDDLTADVQNPAGALALGLSAGIGEELLMRGAIQPRFGIPLTSLLFALLHVQYGLSFVLIGLFLIGAMLGVIRDRYGTTAAIITHAAFNTLVVLAQTTS
jgi:uncharacterized protein